MAVTDQVNRAKELRELIHRGQEEFFNVFELVPQTAQDIYFNKIASGALKTAIVSCTDDTVEKDCQTDELGNEDKGNQAPNDFMQNIQTGKVVHVRKNRDNDARNLEKFMIRAGPVMELVIEESEQLYYLKNKDAVAKRQAVELKQNLKFPDEILTLLGDNENGKLAHVVSITSIHMFETTPQSKCAVAYEVYSPREDLGPVYLIIVYSVTANQVLRICKAESEVT